jgi:hypothetical protein
MLPFYKIGQRALQNTSQALLERTSHEEAQASVKWFKLTTRFRVIHRNVIHYNAIAQNNQG